MPTRDTACRHREGRSTTQAPLHQVGRPTFQTWGQWAKSIPQMRARPSVLRPCESDRYALENAEAGGVVLLIWLLPHFSYWHGRQGLVGRGLAWSGKAEHGSQGNARHGSACCGSAWPGSAGQARRCGASCG
jgi:hypothetical protein